MKKYVLIAGLTLAGGLLAAAGHPSRGGCKRQCVMAYDACIAACTVNGVIDQPCAFACVEEYYLCAGYCR